MTGVQTYALPISVGARVELRRLLAVGGRPLVLGLSSWVIVALVAYVGVTVVWS